MDKPKKTEHWSSREPWGRAGIYQLRLMDGRIFYKRLGDFYFEESDDQWFAEWDKRIKEATGGKVFPRRSVAICPP